jgi:hypothetical protein
MPDLGAHPGWTIALAVLLVVLILYFCLRTSRSRTDGFLDGLVTMSLLDSLFDLID